jgi:cytochrome b
MKLYLYVTLAFAVILGWNVFLIQRDTKMFEAYKQRQAQVCKQLKEISPDCASR